MSAVAEAKIGHNKGPLIAPTEEDMLGDLQGRYPELIKEEEAFKVALATYPKVFNLEDEESAAALQDLLGKMKKHKTVLGAHKKTEKKPWSGLVNVVMNFFAKREENIEALVEEWEPRYADFLKKKQADNVRKAEEESARQRAIEEQARKDAAEAEARAARAREEEEAARRREEEARARAAEEERKAQEAREARQRAEAEEKRIADEKKARDRQERENNDLAFKAMRRHMKDADRLNDAAEDESASDADLIQLDLLIKVGGTVGNLATPVANSLLLDEDQRVEIEGIRTRLGELRKAQNARFDAKEKRRRETERKKAEAAEARAADERRLQREAEEARAEAARKERERLAAEEEAAKERQRAAREEVRDARADQRGAASEQKGAAKDLRTHSETADRAGNRADRVDNKLEKSTPADLSRLRGDLGTVGGLTRRWTRYIVDEAKLRASCGPLGPHFLTDALEGATFQLMRARQSGFIGERVEPADLPGVVFAYEEDTQIKKT